MLGEDDVAPGRVRNNLGSKREENMKRYAIINGKKVEAPSGAIAWKYADPIENGRWVFDEEDLAQIRQEDPSLIQYVVAPITLGDSIAKLREAPAPLYTHQPGELKPSPAYVLMDKDGHVTVETAPPNSGWPIDVWHHRTIRWGVDPCVSGDALADFLESPEAQHLFGQVHAGHIIEWDGNNLVGNLSNPATEAAEKLQEMLDDLDTDEVWLAEEWLAQSGLHEVWSGKSLDEAVQDLLEEAEAGKIYVHNEWRIREVLLGMAEEVFREEGTGALDEYHIAALKDAGVISEERSNRIKKQKSAPLLG
jgi:predicted transcriptional regulator